MSDLDKFGKQSGSDDKDEDMVTEPGLTAVDDQLKGVELYSQSAQEIARMRNPLVRTVRDLSQMRVIFPEMANVKVANAFREIRTKILRTSKENNPVIMVTSIAPDSGSTFVSTNIAAAFAFDNGKTSLLVDCNLRDPGLSEFVPNGGVGLTDFLESREIPVAKIVTPSGIPRLRVVSAGGKRETPGEYFTSEKFRRLFSALKNRYPDRYIVADTPAMSESADTQIITNVCNYVILVVPYGRFTPGQVSEAVKMFEPGKFLGVVFNNVP